jgi:hypothetical protein
MSQKKMKFTYTYFAFICISLLSCSNNKTTRLFKNEIEEKVIFQNYIYPIDKTINEKDLRIDSSQSEVYRVWVLNENPKLSLIITIEKINDTISISKKCFIWNNGLPVKIDSLIEFETKKISLKAWLEFKDKIFNSYFWNLENNQNDDTFLDCNTFIFEGKRDKVKYEKNYNLFYLPCGYGSLRDAFSDLFELTK